MTRLTKKIMIFSLASIMQIGLGATVIEAAPAFNDGSPSMVQLDHRSDRGGDRGDRERQENDRHNREMQRRDGESDRDWHDRQDRENRRHDNTMNEILAGVIGIIIGSQLN